MGMRAEVLAIGTFSREVCDCLEYPPEFYSETQDGKVVFAHLFQCTTTNQSGELADLLGVKPWDFNSHLVVPRRITDEARVALRLQWDDGDLDRFDRLVAAGFKMIYRPEG